MRESTRISYLEEMNEELRALAATLQREDIKSTSDEISQEEEQFRRVLPPQAPTYIVSVIRGNDDLPVFEPQKPPSSPLQQLSVVSTDLATEAIVELEMSTRESITSVCLYSMQALLACSRYLTTVTSDISSSMHKQEVVIDELSIKIAEGIKPSQNSKKHNPRKRSKKRSSISPQKVRRRSGSPKRYRSKSPSKKKISKSLGYVPGIIGISTDVKKVKLNTAIPFSGFSPQISSPLVRLESLTSTLQPAPPSPPSYPVDTSPRSTLPVGQSTSLNEKLTQVSSQETAAEIRNLMLRREIERVNHMRKVASCGQPQR